MKEGDYILKDAEEFEKINSLIPYLEKHNGFIAGGVFKDLFLDRKFRDIDIFFNSTWDAKLAISYFIENKEYTEVYENTNALGVYLSSRELSVDIVHSKFGTPSEILDGFDFSVSKFCLFSDENNKLKVLYHKCFFEDLVNRKLRFEINYNNPVSQLTRVIKYSSYGFEINRDDILKITTAINSLDHITFRDLSFKNLYENE
jgi:hypothetical protein